MVSWYEEEAPCPKGEKCPVHRKAWRDVQGQVAREGSSEESGSRSRLTPDPEVPKRIGLVSLRPSSVTEWRFVSHK